MHIRQLSALAFVLVCLASVSTAQVIHYQTTFDQLKDGELDGQDGWAVGPPANLPAPVVTSAVAHGDVGKSLEVNAQHEVVRNFDPIIDTGIHFLSIWFRFENPGGDNTLHIYFGDTTREWNAGPVIRIGAQSGDPNQVGVHDGGTVKPVAPIRAGEWQHIMSIMDVDNHTYTVYVDDVLAADNFAWRNPAGHPRLGWLMLGFDGGAGLIGYYDDLVFGEGDTLPPSSVEPMGKLATTWAKLK